MRDRGEFTATRRQPPVVAYAALVGALIVLAVVVGVLYGQRHENARPTPVASGVPAPRRG